MKSELIKIVSSPPLLSNYLKDMEQQDLLTITENREKHKKFFIKLTPRGTMVAKQLKTAPNAWELLERGHDGVTGRAKLAGKKRGARGVQDIELAGHAQGKTQVFDGKS